MTEALMNFQVSCGICFSAHERSVVLPPNSFFEPVDGWGEKGIDI